MTFSPEFRRLNSRGETVETGRLEQQAYFAAASRIAASYIGSPGFKFLALSSAEFNAVNTALLAGSKPEDLVIGPPTLMSQEASPIPKPWWRFWT
jgi:hypothetical protein